MRKDELMKSDLLSECVLLGSSLVAVVAFLTVLAATLR
jgi:hypothetical protein